MEEEKETNFPRANTPMTEKQIIAATIGPSQPLNSTIDLVPYDPAWPALFIQLKEQIQVIDMVLAVADSSDEPSYVRALEERGYTLRIREPEWYEHRLLKTPEVAGNLHVFTAGCPEIERMVLFRDWLRTNDEDRVLYEATKRELVARTWKYTQNYADAKSEVVQRILARARGDQC